MKFDKFASALHPVPAPTIMCAKYTKAILANTNGYFEDCVTSAENHPGTGNYAAYATMLTRLCSKKQEREKERESVAMSTNLDQGKSKGQQYAPQAEDNSDAESGDESESEAIDKRFTELLNRIEQLEAL